MEKCKRLKLSAARLREEFLLDRKDKAESEQAKKAIRCIRRHEETRRSWRAIGRSHGKAHSKGISSVQIQDNKGWKDVSDRSTVESAIMDNNSARFNLTKSTPLMAPDMVEKLGYMAEKQLGKDILQGRI